MKTPLLAGLAAAALLAGCAHRPTLPPEPLAQADAAVERVIAARQIPGAALWMERLGHGSHHRAYGQRAVDPAPEPLDEATVFDAASLTKPVVTATLVQLLREQGRLDIEAPLQRYLPGCGGDDKAGITLRQLLTHSSGLPAGLPAKPAGVGAGAGAGDWAGSLDAQRIACGLPLTAPPGTLFRYSDVNFILLGRIVEQVSGLTLDRFAEDALFRPLGMRDSGYLPLRRMDATRIAPTERLKDGTLLRGEVHDPTARKMGGVAGHAGLFTTTADLARFARMLLSGGVAEDGRRLLSADSVALLTTAQSPPALAETRSLGWDMASPYARPRGTLYPLTSFGHTGFTGCAFWLDPGSRSFFVLLSNRVHPALGTNVLPLYGELGTLAAQAAGVPGNGSGASPRAW
ncbi:serine hydrolase domain-containing protein [Roseateles asaccharophilus]|uniref:CubicO group peptidase (Beta-lactamase class C family) n=1 Tax=Roseateles asaccharophilus TaxID=582607 RepID=A0ABU2ADK7_9BURK|nr:serine hydrolase domain-containing protein [Roseateles asaccharophilus]MDR7335060.1 CubicO group peptidase (beta-lactamase class C family) [Roseateles asaccharophilus]